MTITTGTALAPEDDEAPDTDGVHTDIPFRSDTSHEAGVSLSTAPDVVTDISLSIAPDVVTDVSLLISPAVASGVALGVAALPTPEEHAQPQLGDHTRPEVDNPMLSIIALSTTETPPTSPRAPLSDRLRGAFPFTGPGLSWLGGVVLGCLVAGLGAAGDLGRGKGLGLGFTATFLVGCVLVPVALRTRALAVATVLPPLLFAGGYALETKTGGQTAGRREMALDVATSLALHAPVLFIGTALAVAVVLVRVAVHLIRR